MKITTLSRGIFSPLIIQIFFTLIIFCLAQVCVSAQLKISETIEESPCKNARILVGQSNYQKAAQLIKVCLEESSQKNTLEYVENLLLGAEIEYYLENDLKATKYIKEAEYLFNSLGANKQKYPFHGVRLYKLLGDLKVETEEYGVALKYYKKGLSIFDSIKNVLDAEGGEIQRIKADLLSGIAYIELKTGYYDDAIVNLKLALAILKNSNTDESTKAFLLNDLGHLLNEQRSHHQAIIYLKQSAEISERLNNSHTLASSQQNLAVAYRGTGDFNKSRNYFEIVQNSALKNNFKDLQTLSSQGLASLYQYKGEYQKAVKILQIALEQTDSSIRRTEILWYLSSSQNQTGEKAKARMNASECYDWATAQKNENLRYLCATNLGETYSPDSTEEAEKWFRQAIDITENLSQRVSGNEYGKVYFMQDKATAYHKLIKLLVSKNQNTEALAVGEKLKSRVLREKSQNRKIDFLNEKKLNIPDFPADTLSVSFTVTTNECFAFAIREGKIKKIAELPIGENELRKEIQKYRKSILSFSPTFKSEGENLYRLLLGEFENDIAESKRIIIIPDGALWELPFQALISNASGKYLVEESEIFYSPSLNLLSNKLSLSSKKTGQKFIAFANPVRKDTPALPEAEKEALSIGKLYSSSNIFLKDKATINRFNQESEQAEVLHIAVHGVVDSNNPFDSALLFSEEEIGDGRLTVSEILKLDLPSSLLVLSSCDTSSGRVINGEGLLSLSWAFLAAGGRSVIAAQWAVEEKATADLMLKFYQSLNEDQNNSVNALRDAQIQALKRPAPYNHPFYWAGFVSVGAVGPQR